jgi:fructokinase
MRKVIGIGETIMDIVLKNGQPVAAVPGGSVFNGIISLGRLGTNVTVISETGNDRVGREILKFMEDNGVDSSNVNVYADGRTAISLAWLNERNDAEYDFYKDYPKARLEVEWPAVEKDDIVMMSSYFVLNPALRTKVREFLTYAREKGALIYYDFNFRSSHKMEALKLRPDIIENIEFADIVRGSTEDLYNMFDNSDPDKVYRQEIDFYCKNMLCTDSDGDIRLFSPQVNKKYAVTPVQTVSTIGAGDNFNAGIVYGLLKENIGRDDLPTLSEEKWNKVVRCGMDLAAQVCQSLNNSISKEFAESYKK